MRSFPIWGTPCRESDLMKHPLNKVQDYANSRASERVVDGPKRTQSVYGRFRDPQSGIANERNLAGWSGYARAGSYHGGDSTGKDVTTRDPRGGTVPSAARNKDSDGYLADPKEWSRFDRGSESGEGRLEKTHRK
jgi:hypothetical protein